MLFTLTIITPKGQTVTYGLTQTEVNRTLQGWFDWLDRCPNVSIRFEVRQ
jgi:hypothetical protein